MADCGCEPEPDEPDEPEFAEPPPPHPPRPAAVRPRPTITSASQLRSFLRRKIHNAPPARNARVAPLPKPRCKERLAGRANAADCVVVAMVSAVVFAIPLGVTVGGLKLHVTPFDCPLQAKLTC